MKVESTELLENDLFQFGVPLLKSFQVDENGDVIIEGVASVPQEDHQGENLDPRGFILNYFEKSGWIKWEHKGAHNGPASPAQFIGEPMEARITPEGNFHIKARLYRDSPFTKEIKEQLEVLEKSQSSRRMGFSIEGQALQRDPLNKLKVTKAIIRNVVLTMNPVNDGTWVTLCKSLTGPDALEIGFDESFSLEKAMDTQAAAAIMPQSLEGVKPHDADEDETVKALTAFRSYVKRLLNKDLVKSLVDTTASSIVMGAYDHAVDGGLGHKDALEFATTVYENREILKSVPQLVEQGGAGMRKLAQILGESIEELEKSLRPEDVTDEDEELDALIKSLEGNDEAADEDEPDPEANEDEADPEPEEKEDEVEKSLDTDVDLTKSMSTDALEVLDVSAFLNDLVKSVNGTMGAFSADQEILGNGISVLARSMQAQSELLKSLQKQVEELGATPRGRRSATSPAEVVTAKRAGGEPTVAPTDELSKSQVMTLLHGGIAAGTVSAHKISSIEMGYPLDAATARTLGIDPAKNSRWVEKQV